MNENAAKSQKACLSLRKRGIKIQVATTAYWDTYFDILVECYKKWEARLYTELERTDLNLELTLQDNKNEEPTLTMTIRKKEFPA